MKIRFLLAGMISCMLTNAFAINPPAATTTMKPYDGASFVSQPDNVIDATKIAKPKSTKQEPTDPLSTLSLNKNTPSTQVTTINVVKTTTTGCPVTCPQQAGIVVKKEIIQKIVNRQVNSSNANEIEQLLGPACSCITFNPLSAEVWTCQWKGDLASNRLENTINVTFEGGMLASVTAVRSDGVTYMALPNANVTVYQPQ